MANHALEDVEVNGLMVSFGRDRPALVKPERTEVIGGSSGEYTKCCKRPGLVEPLATLLGKASSPYQGLPETNRPVNILLQSHYVLEEENPRDPPSTRQMKIDWGKALSC